MIKSFEPSTICMSARQMHSNCAFSERSQLCSRLRSSPSLLLAILRSSSVGCSLRVLLWSGRPTARRVPVAFRCRCGLPACGHSGPRQPARGQRGRGEVDERRTGGGASRIQGEEAMQAVTAFVAMRSSGALQQSGSTSAAAVSAVQVHSYPHSWRQDGPLAAKIERRTYSSKRSREEKS